MNDQAPTDVQRIPARKPRHRGTEQRLLILRCHLELNRSIEKSTLRRRLSHGHISLPGVHISVIQAPQLMIQSSHFV